MVKCPHKVTWLLFMMLQREKMDSVDLLCALGTLLPLHSASNRGKNWQFPHQLCADLHFVKSFKYPAWSVKSVNCQQTSTLQKIVAIYYSKVRDVYWEMALTEQILSQTKIWNKRSPKDSFNPVFRDFTEKMSRAQTLWAALLQEHHS